MAGFPVPQLDRYLKILVQTHKRSVAMCEEFRRPGQTEKFTRKVTRILTPGTLIDEPFLNPFENNYLLAISTCATSKSLGLAWIDVSTGEFFSETSELASLPDDLARIKPSEVVLCHGTSCTHNNQVTSILKEEKYHVNFAQPTKLRTPSKPSNTFSESDNIMGGESNLAFSEEEGKAISLLTTFLRDHLLDHMPEMVSPSRLKRGSRMLIDAQTIRSLEIKESMNGEGITGSLISTIKRTVTQSGTRLLTRWICRCPMKHAFYRLMS
jgi:DNA mismatch repair ATPase MutS